MSTSSARLTSSGRRRAPSPADTVTVPPAGEVRVEAPASERGSSSYVEYFGGWIAAGWVARGGGEGEVGHRRRALRARRRAIVVLRGGQHGPGRTGIPGGDEPVRCRRGVRRRHLRGGPRAGSRLRPHGLLLTTGPQRRHQVERLRGRRIGAGRRGPDLDRPGGGGHHGRVERIGDHQRVGLARHLGCGLHAGARGHRSVDPVAHRSHRTRERRRGPAAHPQAPSPHRGAHRHLARARLGGDLPGGEQRGRLDRPLGAGRRPGDRGASAPAGWATTTLRPPAPSNPPPPGSSRPPWPASRPSRPC